LPGAPRALLALARAAPLPRSRQPDDGLRDAVGLRLVLAVPDHLVGQPAGGDPLVPDAHRSDVAGSGRGAGAVPLRRALRGPARAALEAERARPGAPRRAALPGALPRLHLVDRAGLPRDRGHALRAALAGRGGARDALLAVARPVHPQPARPA